MDSWNASPRPRNGGKPSATGRGNVQKLLRGEPAVYESEQVVKWASNPLYFLRKRDKKIDSDGRLPREGEKGEWVYDWRVSVPAYMQLVALRLMVMAATDLNGNMWDFQRISGNLPPCRKSSWTIG